MALIQLRTGTKRTLCSIIRFDTTLNIVLHLPFSPFSYYAPSCICCSFWPAADKSSEIWVISLSWPSWATLVVLDHHHSCLMRGLSVRQPQPWVGLLAGFLEHTLLPAPTNTCYGAPEHGCPSALVILYMINGHHWKWVHTTKYSGSNHLTWQSDLSCSLVQSQCEFLNCFLPRAGLSISFTHINKNVMNPLILRLWSWKLY